MSFFKKHFLTLTIIPLLLLSSTSAYYRFVSQQDYIVSYAGDCDPDLESCYLEEDFLFTIIERDAGALRDICGPDVLECDDAYSCDADESCEIYECDPELDGEEACVGPNN